MTTEITSETFGKLLAWFGSDPNQAGERYEKIRRKLIKLFEFRGALSPNDLADEVINRVAQKIADGVEIQASDPYVYFYGVAQNVLREDWKSPEREMVRPESLTVTDEPVQGLAELEQAAAQAQLREHRHQCLDSCLLTLSPEQRSLLVQYYQGETTAKIQNRERMSQEFGISANALRIRAHRIREKIEACVTACVNRLGKGRT
ncbi:MAG: hypothetical protein K1Y36_16770 [Blastocatellia bacterium]|nr:hypothetical protein [Blastocatellia bacterium]